ncbi:MAG TPA: ABC transporter permease [Acidimicrobiia bacterium]
MAFESRGFTRVVEREWLVWRRLWRGSVFSYVFAPLLFLAAMGIGLGDLIDKHQGTVQGLDYLEFITPGLMAASATMAAAAESLWPVMFGVKWGGTYFAAVSTPVEARDVYLGQLAWTGIRSTMAATVFLAIAAVLGGVPSFWGLLAIPAAVLGALAIAAPLSAWAVERESDGAFSVVMRIVVFPLFLFSGTFFPVSRLPDWLEPVALLSPLYHAVELCRAATTGDFAFFDNVANVAVLLAFVGVGVWWGERTFRRVLSQ